ncbi:MAG: acyl-CoA dehydrogenase, partial [Myxococcaceae bacterium]|nr:acyl-CoA dehydrogenase [Myxococcaceae bacterium]
IEASRLLCWRAAWMADAGISNAKEASMSKAFAARAAIDTLSDLTQVMGAAGVMSDHFVEKWFRDIRVYDIFEGTGEIQRIVISKRILKDLKAF